MEKLPKEAINKIMFFLSHPVAEIFKIELEIAHKAFEARKLLYRGQEEFLADSIYPLDDERYTEIGEEEDEIRNYEDYCDCCATLWSECQCVCSNCHGNYRECRYNCYNDEQGLNIMNH